MHRLWLRDRAESAQSLPVVDWRCQNSVLQSLDFHPVDESRSAGTLDTRQLSFWPCHHFWTQFYWGKASTLGLSREMVVSPSVRILGG